jgi:hypothetical protein
MAERKRPGRKPAFVQKAVMDVPAPNTGGFAGWWRADLPFKTIEKGCVALRLRVGLMTDARSLIDLQGQVAMMLLMNGTLADGVVVVDQSAHYDRTIAPRTMEVALWTTTHPSWRTTGQRRLHTQSLLSST